MGQGFRLRQGYGGQVPGHGSAEREGGSPGEMEHTAVQKDCFSNPNEYSPLMS